MNQCARARLIQLSENRRSKTAKCRTKTHFGREDSIVVRWLARNENFRLCKCERLSRRNKIQGEDCKIRFSEGNCIVAVQCHF